MDLILKILGAVFLTMIVLIVVAILVVRWKLRKVLGKLGSLAETMVTPRSLDLHQIVGDIKWEREDAVLRISERLQKQGFVSLGVFQTQAMGDLQLEGWADASRSLMAAVYQHSSIDQPWLDYVRQYEGSPGDTTSNAPMGGETDEEPGSVKVVDPSAEPDELLETMIGLARDLPIRPAPTTADEFKARFEEAYARSMQWRAARGGTNEAEIRRIAAASGQDLPEAILEATLQMQRTQANEQLEELLLEQFQQETKLSVAEWENSRERLVFVHDNLSADDLNEIVSSWTSWDDEEHDESDPFPEELNTSARSDFAAFNRSLPSAERFEKLGEISEPIAADVYRAPPDPDS